MRSWLGWGFSAVLAKTLSYHLISRNSRNSTWSPVNEKPVASCFDRFLLNLYDRLAISGQFQQNHVDVATILSLPTSN